MKSPHISDYLTHIDNPEDVPYLRAPLFDVNMRLFGSSPFYRDAVLACADVIARTALTKYRGYKLPHGTSGANVAIPFNIIVVVQNRGTPEAYAQIMINPKIVAYGKETVDAESNCGSIRLKEPILVRRSKDVTVEWYDGNGVAHKKVFGREEGSLTIQHEVDHNRGVLITDRAVPVETVS